jgi:hypothetical protein
MLHEYWPPALKCYINVDHHWNATWMLTSFIEMLHECWPTEGGQLHVTCYWKG